MFIQKGGCQNPFGKNILVPKATGPAPGRGRLVCDEAHPKKKLTRRWLAPPIPNELLAT